MSREVTREILGAYRDMGHRPALVEWRQNIPPDVRKIWFRHLIEVAGKDKLITNSLREIISDRISEQDRIRLEALRMDPEKAHEYIPLLRSFINEEMLTEFARRYFTTFETDPALVDEFFHEQERQRQLIIPAFEVFPAIETILITGSSAIGPRTKAYGKKKQDLDILILLREHDDYSVDNETEERISEMQGVYVGDRTEEEAVHLTPTQLDLVRYCKSTRILPDFHVAEWLTDGALLNSSYRKLIGPHKVLYIAPESGEACYQAYIDRAIETARFKKTDPSAFRLPNQHE